MTIINVISYIVIGMLNDDGQLSPDLVWMLQSNQFDVDALTEALVSSYYQQIYSNALSRLTYPEEAHRAAQDTLFLAIANKKEYRGETSISDWIDRIANVIILERKTRLKNCLFLNPRLIESIGSRQAENTLSDRQIQFAINEIKSKIYGIRLSRSNWAYMKLIGLTGLLFFMAYLLVNFDNPISSATPDKPVHSSTETSFRGGSDIQLAYREKPHLSQDNRIAEITEINLAPLSIGSSPEEVKDRIIISNQLWSMMWADIVVSFNGPASYIGPPFTERHQLWIDQVGGAIQIIGPPQGIPDAIEKATFPPGRSPTQFGFIKSGDYAKLGSEFPWFSIKSETVFLFPYAINFFFNIMEQDFIFTSEISVVGEEFIADREAVIIELTSPKGNIHARIWLDTQIGIILKEQYFDPAKGSKVILESTLRRIHFDDSTPTRRKEPESSTFASREIHPGPSGLLYQSSAAAPDYPMMGFPFRLPPPGLDPSNARITFAKADHQNLDKTNIGKFHLFANDYFLRNFELIDPLKVICDRSPDGSRLVMANWGIFPTDVSDKVYWLDLQNLVSFQINIPDLIVYWISFSPDNQWIVVTGYDKQDAKNSFFLIDANTGEFVELPILAGISSIAWSPDSTEIAVLDLSFSPSDFKSSIRIRIFDVIDGDEKRRFISNKITDDAKKLEVDLDGWTAIFQFPLQDISRCTGAP